MSFKQFNQREFLQKQYKTKDNLQVRIDTHEQYTEPKSDYLSFMLDHISWTGREGVIDVGCGAGAYVQAARERCGRYIACDLSLGMLRGLPMPDLARVNLDAQRLPFAGETADVILANHMLYHVPDLDTAVGEFYRVLRPGGHLLAATNSDNNMPELYELRYYLGQHFGFSSERYPKRPSSAFTLENGGAALERHFDSVVRHDLKNALVFRESQPVVDYINTSRDFYLGMMPEGTDWEEVEGVIHGVVNGRIAETGAFRVGKVVGVFVCGKGG